ncbi:MAG: SPOR domain-containing protein [Cocleimonas sp.]|nr:SPOR domain-containing protein [Cocleimonas sp.]
MRLILIALVLLNLIYFIVVFLLGDATYTPPAPMKQGIPGIELLKKGSLKITLKGNRRCFTLGPFNSKKATKLVAKRLDDSGSSVKLRHQKTMDTLNYLVYLPSQNNREAALKIIADIKKFDIKDYHLIKGGPYKNAISFGFFNDLNKARRHSEYIRYLGYDSQYTEQKAVREIFWLDYDERRDQNTPVLKWSRTIDPSSVVQKIPRWCEF